MLFNPLCYSTNDLPFSGSSTFPTSSTQTDYMSQSAPVPEGPAMPTGSIRVSPSRHNRVSGQGQQDGQLVRSSVQSFILSVILQNNPNFHDYEPSTLPLKNDNWPGYHLKPVDQIWLVWNLIFLKYQQIRNASFTLSGYQLWFSPGVAGFAAAV